MNAEAIEISTALTVPERARTAMAAVTTAEKLTELAKRSTSITAITNKDGAEQCHTARMVLRNQRIEIERRGKEVRDDATKFSKAVITEEKRLIALIAPEEDRLDVLETEWNESKERERQARVQAELDRVNEIQGRIEAIRKMADVGMMPSGGIECVIEGVAAIAIDETYAEFQSTADDAKRAALSRLQDALTDAQAREAEAARIKAEREELARLRAAEAERQKAERARIADEERIARVERERIESEARAAREAEESRLRAERAAQEEELRRQREAIAAEKAEADRISRERQAEFDRKIRAQHEQQLAEAAQLREAREALEREQAALKAAQEPAREPVVMASAGVPTGAEMLVVLAEHYDEAPEMVLQWIENAEWEIAA